MISKWQEQHQRAEVDNSVTQGIIDPCGLLTHYVSISTEDKDTLMTNFRGLLWDQGSLFSVWETKMGWQKSLRMKKATLLEISVELLPEQQRKTTKTMAPLFVEK